MTEMEVKRKIEPETTLGNVENEEESVNPNPFEGMTEERMKERVEEIVRFILSQFFAFFAMYRIPNVNDLKKDLKQTFFLAGAKVARDHTKDVKMISFLVLRQMGISRETLLKMGLNHMIYGMTARWFLTNFECIRTDLETNHRVLKTMEPFKKTVIEYIEHSFNHAPNLSPLDELKTWLELETWNVTWNVTE